jgi:hypothetical protein
VTHHDSLFPRTTDAKDGPGLSNFLLWWEETDREKNPNLVRQKYLPKALKKIFPKAEKVMLCDVTMTYCHV